MSCATEYRVRARVPMVVLRHASPLITKVEGSGVEGMVILQPKAFEPFDGRRPALPSSSPRIKETTANAPGSGRPATSPRIQHVSGEPKSARPSTAVARIQQASDMPDSARASILPTTVPRAQLVGAARPSTAWSRPPLSPGSAHQALHSARGEAPEVHAAQFYSEHATPGSVTDRTLQLTGPSVFDRKLRVPKVILKADPLGLSPRGGRALPHVPPQAMSHVESTQRTARPRTARWCSAALLRCWSATLLLCCSTAVVHPIPPLLLNHHQARLHREMERGPRTVRGQVVVPLPPCAE